MDTENKMKELEDKLNDAYGICTKLREGMSIPAKGKTNIYVLLIASIYLDYGYTELSKIYEKINEVCDIDISELESIIELNIPGRQDEYNELIDLIISFSNVDRYLFIDYIMLNRFNYETTKSMGEFVSNILGQVPDAKLLDTNPWENLYLIF